MWTHIADGTFDNVPDVPLQPGYQYRLVIDLPFQIPDWIAARIGGGLRLGDVNITAIRIDGQTIDLEFDVPANYGNRGPGW